MRRDGIRVDELDQVHIPDPVSQELCKLEYKISVLSRKLEEYEKTAINGKED